MHTESSDWETNRIGFSNRARMAGGQPIGKLMATALQFPDLISLAAGFVDNATLPCEAVHRILNAKSSDLDWMRRGLQYGSTAGNTELREAIAEWSYAAWPEAKPPAERMILTSGSNQFLHMVAEALIDPGDIVLAPAPTYFVFLGTLRGVGARVIGVHADEHGLCMDSLSEHLEQLEVAGLADRVKAIYTVTDFDNPGASTLSLQRRGELLEMVSRWRHKHGNLVVLSDNAYQQLRYSGEDLPPLLSLHEQASEFVIELGTFSKSFSPGIRVGWGVVPQAMVHPLLDFKSNVDFGSPHFSQMLMLEAIRSGALESHLPVIRRAYREKLTAMLAALETEFGDGESSVHDADTLSASGAERVTREGIHWRQPQGGLYVWLTLPEHVDASDEGPLWAAATEKGVLYVPGYYCYPSEGEPVAKNTIRLSFGVQPADGIREGIHRLADATRGVLSKVAQV